MSWRGWSTHLAIETVLAHAVLRRRRRADLRLLRRSPPDLRRHARGRRAADALPLVPRIRLGGHPRRGIRQRRAARRARCRDQRQDRSQAGRGTDDRRRVRGLRRPGAPARAARSRVGGVVPLSRHALATSPEVVCHLSLLPGQRHRGGPRAARDPDAHRRAACLHAERHVLRREHHERAGGASAGFRSGPTRRASSATGS